MTDWEHSDLRWLRSERCGGIIDNVASALISAYLLFVGVSFVALAGIGSIGSALEWGPPIQFLLLNVLFACGIVHLLWIIYQAGNRRRANLKPLGAWVPLVFMNVVSVAIVISFTVPEIPQETHVLWRLVASIAAWAFIIGICILLVFIPMSAHMGSTDMAGRTPRPPEFLYGIFRLTYGLGRSMRTSRDVLWWGWMAVNGLVSVGVIVGMGTFIGVLIGRVLASHPVVGIITDSVGVG